MSSDILLQSFTWWHKHPNTSPILRARTLSLNLSKVQTVLAVSEVKICILALEFSLSWGLCYTGAVVAARAEDCAQTVPHHHGWAPKSTLSPPLLLCVFLARTDIQTSTMLAASVVNTTVKMLQFGINVYYQLLSYLKLTYFNKVLKNF